jgi:hypothetical protein
MTYRANKQQQNDGPRTRIITLSDRPPVRIRDDEWPVIGEAFADSYKGNDYARHQQAAAQGELDTYTIKVRQHADGRCLVYAVLKGATAWTGTKPMKAGRLVAQAATQHLADIIREVGSEADIPDDVIQTCIGSLPAEEL